MVYVKAETADDVMINHVHSFPEHASGFDPMFDKKIKFNAPALSYLNDETIQTIHRASIRIMEQTGCIIDHPDVLGRLQQKGVKKDPDGRVRIPGELVEWAWGQAPSGLTIYNRDQEPALSLRDNHVYFGTGSDCPYLLDIETAQPRPFTFKDMRDAVRVADALPHIDFIMSMGLAGDLNPETAYQEKYRAMLENSNKPQVLTSGPRIDTLADIVEMASAVAGSMDQLRKHPGFLLLLNPTSPLVHSREAMDKLAYMAENDLPVIYAPGIMAGGTGPVTMAGAVAQANSEILAGLVVHQLVRPGAPFVYGGGMSPMDMKSGQPTYSAPEAMMTQAGLCQLGRDLYHLPTWGFGGCSSSKICDAQAVNEAATFNLMAAWAGTNLVHDVGYIEFGKTYSLELLVLCNEFIGQVRRMMGGIVVDDEQLAVDAIHRTGPGGAFLADPHTTRHFRDNWEPALTDRKTRKRWQKNGSRSMLERAGEQLREILNTHVPEPMDEEVLERMDGVATRGGSGH